MTVSTPSAASITPTVTSAGFARRSRAATITASAISTTSCKEGSSFMAGVTTGHCRLDNVSTPQRSSLSTRRLLYSAPVTAQKATLKPYLDEIRQWVSQGRTDIWIAHALNSTPGSISAFRSANGILRRDVPSEVSGVDVPPPVAPPDAPPEELPTRPKRRSRSRKPAVPEAAAAPAATSEPAAAADGAPAKRRRRGGRGRRKRDGYEAVLDTGEEGYGFWLDAAVRDDPVFAEHWAARRGILVRVEADQIVIRPDDRA
jgi:hypothetical protein